MFFQKKNYGNFIIKTLKEITFEKNITRNTNLNTDLDIDSIGWVSILFKIEKEFGQFRDLDSLVNCTYETVDDMINIIRNHYED